MKKQNTWIISLMLVILMIVVPGCTDTNTPGENTGDPGVVTPVVQDLSVVADGASSYSVIVRESASDAVEEAARNVLNTIQSATGAKLTFCDDYVMNGDPIPEKEILVGVTNREESLSLLKDVPYGAYAIRVVDEKIVIVAWDEDSLNKACAVFSAMVRKTGTEGSLLIPADYTEDGVGCEALQQLPHYGAADEAIQTVDLGDACYMVYAKDTDAEEFRAYQTVLENAGYTQFASRQYGNNLHMIYTSEDKIIHASFMAKDKDARISIEDAYDMTLFTEQEYEKICEPSVTLVGQEGYMNDSEGVPNQIGLCLIFRLEDGRFIVVDGGDYVPAAGPLLMRTLRSLAVDQSNITIAAWIVTHAHSDHTGGFVHFTEDLKYHRQVKVENIIHHLVRTEQYDTLGDPGQSQRVRNMLPREYPKATVIKAHTGQLFKIAGMEIEMLFTYEDLEPSPLEYHNTSSLVFRVTAQDNTVLVLGDASNRSCGYMVHSYGDFLKSDIVQVAHHGYTGGTIPLYEAIDADVLLWPCGVASIDGSYERLMERDYNAKAVELAEEVYIAGKFIHTLPLPYTPEDVETPRIIY